MAIITTSYYRINPKVPNLTYIQTAASVLRSGGTVAFPTETVYGLGANALDGEAVKKIFKAKGRPSDNPLIVHIACVEDIYTLTSHVPERAKLLMDAFWPGPLTIILPKSSRVPSIVTAGLANVAIRIPSHPIALALIKATRLPIAAPSANLSGRPSPTTGEHVLKDLKGKVNVILDGGKVTVGLESTVIDLTGEKPMILRPGGITLEQIEEIIGKTEYDPALLAQNVSQGFVPKAPGMKYTHYAPKTKVSMVEGDGIAVAKKFKELIAEAKKDELRVGILCTEEMLFLCKEIGCAPHHFEVLGSGDNLEGIANKLYSSLRNCDRFGLDIAYTETFKTEGLGTAIMNRLQKAAGYRVILA